MFVIVESGLELFTNSSTDKMNAKMSIMYNTKYSQSNEHQPVRNRNKLLLLLAVIKDYESAFDAVQMFIQIP